MIDPKKGQALQLEEILEIAEGAFRAQIAKAGKHPECHEKFYEDRWSGVVAHVSIQCGGKAGTTKDSIERCVHRQWTLKKILVALAKMAPPPERKPSSVKPEHRGGWSGPPRVIWAQKGGTGGFPVA